MPETRDEHIDAGRTTADAAHEPEPPNGRSAAELLMAAMFEAGPEAAEHLLKAGEKAEARQVMEQGLDDYQYLTGPSRRRDRRWVGKAKQLRQQAG